MKRDIHIVMHTHWDREWYFSKDETHVLLIHDMIEVIQFLETHPNASYVLDGQAVMLDDFLLFAPHYKDRLTALVQQGRLKIGPWYTQTDLRLVYGESIIRNLYYGIKRCLEFGDVMKVGYAPDTFGHASQMPQIYHQFGIKSTFFWRGLSTLKAAKSDFIWKGIDGTSIYGINLATGYQGAKYLETSLEGLTARMNKIMPVLDTYSASNARLIMNGHDQMPIQQTIYQVIEHMRTIDPEASIRISSFEDYIDALKDADLEVVDGELVDSQHARIHRTISSTRMDIKLLVRNIERDIYHVLEPLSVIGQTVGIEYPHHLIEHCLKVLFGVHAHDSMGGCNGDYVNQDIKQRLLNTQELVHYQIELTKRIITESRHKEDTVTVFQLLPFKQMNQYVDVTLQTRSQYFTIHDEKQNRINFQVLSQEYVDAGLIDRQVAARLENQWVYITTVRMLVDEIDGLSVRYYSFEETGSDDTIKSKDWIENEYYAIKCVDNQLQLTIKSTNQIIKSLIKIENSGDAGDSYDYSPPVSDFIIDTPSSLVINAIESGVACDRMNITMCYEVPSDELNRHNRIVDKTVSFDLTINLNKDSKLIDVSCTHINSVKDTRYRIVLDTAITAQSVLSDSILSTMSKPIVNKQPLDHWIQDKWVEKPVSIEPFQSFIQVDEDQKACTVYSHDIAEYEFVGQNMYLTLFRGFSHLGKSNLVNRPGRPSGIMLETPDHQLMNQTMTWNFVINFEADTNPAMTARIWLTALQSDQIKYYHRFNINRPAYHLVESNLNLELNGACLSACKLGELNQLVIRVYNPLAHKVKMTCSQPVYDATIFEEKLGELKAIELQPQQIKTIIIGGTYERL